MALEPWERELARERIGRWKARWVSAKEKEFQNADAPASRQHFDVWSFQCPIRAQTTGNHFP